MLTGDQLGEYVKLANQYPNLSALDYVSRNADEVVKSHQRVLDSFQFSSRFVGRVLILSI